MNTLDSCSVQIKEFFQSPPGILEHELVGLRKVGLAVLEVDRGAFEKQVRVGLDQAGQDGEVRKNRIGLRLAGAQILRRRLASHEADLLRIIPGKPAENVVAGKLPEHRKIDRRLRHRGCGGFLTHLIPRPGLRARPHERARCWFSPRQKSQPSA